MKIFLSLLFACLLSITGFAQSYVTGVGVRVGNSIGVSVAQRILPSVTLDGIIQNNLKNTTYLHILARYHRPLLTKGFNAYFGGGAHLGTQNEVGGIAGIDGVVGLELNLNRITVSADLKPQWTSGPGNGLILNSGVSVRYIILKNSLITQQGREGIQKNQEKRERKKKRAAKKKLRKGLFVK